MLASFLKRISSGKSRLLVVVVAAFLLGLFVRGGGDPAPPSAPVDPEASRTATIWTCSMHPQIRLPEPGQCPICFMDLIPLEDGADEDLGPRTLQLSEAAAARAEIQTVPVARRPVEAEIRLVGKVAYDETRYRAITAWVPGRIDTLLVDYTGTTVRRGEPLVSLYSPELYTAQTELLSALEAVRALAGSDIAIMRQTAAATVASARERLRLWGLTPDQIAGIERRGKASHHLRIVSPLAGVVVHKNAVEGVQVRTGDRLYTVADLSRVWAVFDAYESDLSWLREGQEVRFRVEAVPGRTFSGEIVFIDPILEERTRTVEVRLDVDNRDGLLKPGMFAHAVVEAAAQPAGEPPLVIPASAPLITGKRAVVYVRLPGHEKPTFEGREVVLGPRAGDRYVVESGLAEGELVVVKGNFKIDSALQIQARPSMMNPGGGGPAPGDVHGGPAHAAAGHAAGGGGQAAADVGPAVQEVPATLREQLGTVLESYLDLQEALAGDDDEAAARAAARVEATLADVDMTLLAGDAHLAWMEDLARLRPAVSAVRGGDGLAHRREAFRPLSDALWASLRRFGYAGGRTVRRFHCPMAFQGEGADWMQRGKTAANPYYGASMLRCGSQTDSLAAVADTEGGR